MHTGVDGIALSCDTDTLFFSPLTSQTLYAIPTAVLRDSTLSDTQLNTRVQVLGYKLSASDGLAAASNGALFATALQLNGI